jgi:ribosomal protein L35
MPKAKACKKKCKSVTAGGDGRFRKGADSRRHIFTAAESKRGRDVAFVRRQCRLALPQGIPVPPLWRTV